MCNLNVGYAAKGPAMMVHVFLRRTHHAFIKRDCQRLRVDMNHHVHPSEGHLGTGRLAANFH